MEKDNVANPKLLLRTPTLRKVDGSKVKTHQNLKNSIKRQQLVSLSQLMRLVNPWVLLVLAYSMAVTYVCIEFNGYFMIEPQVLIFATVFPLTFALNTAYARRERAVLLVHRIESHLQLIYLMHVNGEISRFGSDKTNNSTLIEERTRDEGMITKNVKDLLRSLGRTLDSYLISSNEALVRYTHLLSMRRTISSVQLLNETFMPRFYHITHRCNELLRSVSNDLDELRVYREYRVPFFLLWLVRALAFIAPVVVAPNFARYRDTCATRICIAPYVCTAVFVFVTVNLYIAFIDLEDCFDGVGVDDVLYAFEDDFAVSSKLGFHHFDEEGRLTADAPPSAFSIMRRRAAGSRLHAATSINRCIDRSSLRNAIDDTDKLVSEGELRARSFVNVVARHSAARNLPHTGSTRELADGSRRGAGVLNGLHGTSKSPTPTGTSPEGGSPKMVLGSDAAWAPRPPRGGSPQGRTVHFAAQDLYPGYVAARSAAAGGMGGLTNPHSGNGMGGMGHPGHQGTVVPEHVSLELRSELPSRFGPGGNGTRLMAHQEVTDSAGSSQAPQEATDI